MEPRYSVEIGMRYNSIYCRNQRLPGKHYNKTMMKHKAILHLTSQNNKNIHLPAIPK